MEPYLQEGLKKFSQEVNDKFAKLVIDLEPYVTELIRATTNANIKQSKEMFLSAPVSTASKLNQEIADIRSNYGDMPELMEPSLKAVEDQFNQLLVAHRNNLDNYIIGMKRQLIK